MGKGLWLFEFENTKEAERILRDGSRRIGGFSFFLKKWAREDGCITERDIKEVAWVRLIGLPVHLWSCPILRRIGDCCGGFLAMDEDTTFLSDFRWARIRVKWNGKTLPQFVKVFEGQNIYEIQLWWEIPPFFRSASALREPKIRNEIRVEEEEGARAGESVSSVGSRLEKTDGIEGVPSCRERLSAFLA